jgi:hypothetical protein
MDSPVRPLWNAAASLRCAAILIAVACPFVAAPEARADCTGVCKPNEAVVGEDADNCYCRDRKEYAGCIADAGRAWRNNRPQCGVKAEQCFRSQGYQLTAAGLGGVACVGNCAAASTVPVLVRSCITTCAGAAAIATSVLEKCAVDLNNQCQGDELSELKKAQLRCRQ